MKFSAFLLAVLSISNTAFSQWTQTIGPDGALSQEIFHVGNYLVVNGVNGGVFRSSDTGNSWEAVNAGLPPDFKCWAMDVDNDHLYVATEHGIYHSGNLGDSWDKLTDIVAFSLKVAGSEIFAGYHNGVIYYSGDGGSTWITRNGPPVSNTVRRILKFGGKLWLGNDSNFHSSSDNGVTWDKPDLNLVVSGLHAEGGDLYVSGNNGFGQFTVSRSSDFGASWTTLLTTGENNVFSSGFYKKGNEIFISGAAVFYYSDNNGLSWTSHPFPPGFTFYGGSSMATVDDAFIVSYSDGLLFSGDKGSTWQRRNNGFANHTINKIMKTNNALVSLSETSGVFISSDEGAHWKAIHDRNLLNPQYIYAYGNTIIISYALDVYKSTDDGATWKTIFTLDITGVNSIPALHLSGYKQSVMLSTFRGVYLSKDLGETWNFKSSSAIGTNEPYLKGFVQRDTVIVLAENEMFFSNDFGDTWKQKDKPEDLIAANTFVTDFIMDPPFIMMSTYNGLYRSSDFGTSWTKITCIPHPIIFDMEKTGETLILATYLGVFASASHSAGWYPVRNGLNDARVLSILVDENLSYAGTWGKSVWKIPTNSILITGEVTTIEGEVVPTPIIEAECSMIKIINTTAEVKIYWYKDGVPIPNQTSPTLIATDPGTYSASFENFCDWKESRTVHVKGNNRNDIKIFNVATPNGDGKNDFYYVEDDLIGSRLQVINRWGEIIYANDSYHNEWSPDQLPSGEYFYSIESKCYGSFKGALTILNP